MWGLSLQLGGLTGEVVVGDGPTRAAREEPPLSCPGCSHPTQISLRGPSRAPLTAKSREAWGEAQLPTTLPSLLRG